MAAAEQKVQAILEAGDDPFALLVRCNCCPARGALIRADGRLTFIVVIRRSSPGRSSTRSIGPSGTSRTPRSLASTVGCAAARLAGGAQDAALVPPLSQPPRVPAALAVLPSGQEHERGCRARIPP